MKEVQYFFFFQPAPAGTRKKPSLTRWKLSMEDAMQNHPTWWPDLASREVRRIPETSEELAERSKWIEGYGARQKTEAELDFETRTCGKGNEP
ncbi:hypothetical protein J7E49_12350 [Variovorax paradoxus]|nr:hypothetical protein [Variovorax paradoxus]